MASLCLGPTLDDELRVGVSNRALPLVLGPFATVVFGAITFLLAALLVARGFGFACTCDTAC